jgi:hypothetical protein
MPPFLESIVSVRAAVMITLTGRQKPSYATVDDSGAPIQLTDTSTKTF